jgi:hypothetical protein
MIITSQNDVQVRENSRSEILDGMRSVTVPARFCGPPDSGNGGYTCGLLARELGGVVECTLRAPVPLDAPLQLERAQAGGALRRDEKVVVEARPAIVAVPPPASISLQAATEAMASSPALALSSNGAPQHPFPTCFVCGPRRAVGDGLRIFPAPVDGGVHVASWVPDPEFGDGERLLRPEFLWAALDCPTGFAAGFPTVGKLVTGRMAVQQLKGIRTGEGCVLMAWPLGLEGRKHFSAACLYQNQELRAVARATWIRLEA